MRRPTRLLATATVLMLTIWSAHAVAPEHPHELSAYASALAALVNLDPGDTAHCDTVLTDVTLTDATCAHPTPTTTLPTPTVMPTATMLPVPTPGAEVFEGVPLCTDHNPTTWHPLVKRDANNAITCTYGHEHHDDPNAVNDIFGAPSAWYGGSQEISYPWQTSSALGVENVLKHEGYKWYVARDLPCLPALPTQDPGCIVSYRVQVHTLGTAADATVRFHSFGVEELVDYKGQRGIVRHGGVMDAGHLRLSVDQGGSRDLVCPILPNDRPFTRCAEGPAREHSGANVPAPHTGHNIYDINWYTQNAMVTIQPRLEEWGPIDYADPAHQLFFSGRPDGFTTNNSRGRIENFTTNIGAQQFLKPFTDVNRLVNYSGYTDRLAATSSCTAPGPDCVPLVVEHVYNGSLYYLSAAVSRGTVASAMREHDVKSPLTQRSLIRFPN